MGTVMSTEMNDKWWKNAVVYQIYPRSFADSNDDGVGDLAGIAQKVPYLVSLGVDAIWLSPFYPSPLADGGYDVSDYCDVDPRLGTLEQFNELVELVHSNGIKVIVDIVPNHTSDQHPWFRKALAAQPGSEERNKYVFHRGKGKSFEEPPTNWQSNFGGSAWEPCGDGWYYLHLFAKEQPDLNWNNPEVRKDFLKILKFWSDRGVDGFRIDVSHALAKDLREPLRDRQNPSDSSPEAVDGSDPLWDRNEVHEIYREWRRLFNTYTPAKFAIGETWTPFTSRVFQYAHPDELGEVFDFSLLKTVWDKEKFKAVISRTYRYAKDAGSIPVWVMENHDVPRMASRLGLSTGVDVEEWVTSDGRNPEIDEESTARRAKAAALLLLGLPGMAFLYQGEELGLPEDLELTPAQIKDPLWERTGHRFKGRDGARIPLPWHAEGASFGFNESGKSWLPQPKWWGKYSVETQKRSENSSLEMYSKALKLRRTRFADVDDALTWVKSDEKTLHIARGNGIHVLVNFSQESVLLPQNTRVLVRSDEKDSSDGNLGPESAVWFVEENVRR